MDINNIYKNYTFLMEELKHAVAHMNLNDQVFKIHEAIRDLQRTCPHNNGNYDFSNTEECPYCGKKFRGD